MPVRTVTLLNDALKKDFGFQGFVLSDWGATHSTTKAALAGLDMEMPDDIYFADALEKAVKSGEVPMSRLDDMVHRLLRTEFAVGLFDLPPDRKVVDIFAGFEVAQRVAEQGSVLLEERAGPITTARVAPQVDCGYRIACGHRRALRGRFGAGRSARRKRGAAAAPAPRRASDGLL